MGETLITQRQRRPTPFSWNPCGFSLDAKKKGLLGSFSKDTDSSGAWSSIEGEKTALAEQHELDAFSIIL